MPLKSIILTICALTSLLIPVHHKDPTAHASGEGAPVAIIKTPKPVQKLTDTKLAEVAVVEPVPVPAPPAPPAPVAVAPAPIGGVVPGCGDNMYANYIYMHESGCNTGAVNSIGCRGIGQACPGSKLPCGADYACQNAYFTAYANSAYGGWANAYGFWLSHHWW